MTTIRFLTDEAIMSKPKQWKQGRELKHADAWDAALPASELQSCVVDGRIQLNDAYPPHEQPTDAIWIGSGDAA